MGFQTREVEIPLHLESFENSSIFKLKSGREHKKTTNQRFLIAIRTQSRHLYHQRDSFSFFVCPSYVKRQKRQQEKHPLTRFAFPSVECSRRIRYKSELLNPATRSLNNGIAHKGSSFTLVSGAACPPDEFLPFLFLSLRGLDLFDWISRKRRQRFTLQVFDGQMRGQSPSWHWNNSVLFCLLFLSNWLLPRRLFLATFPPLLHSCRFLKRKRHQSNVRGSHRPPSPGHPLTFGAKLRFGVPVSPSLSFQHVHKERVFSSVLLKVEKKTTNKVGLNYSRSEGSRYPKSIPGACVRAGRWKK